MERISCAKSAKEVQRDYRERVKQDKKRYHQHKLKDRERMKRVREKNKKLPVKEKIRRKELARMRQQRFRAKLRDLALLNEENKNNPFSNPQSLGKAVKRAERGLPRCPARKQAVLGALMSKFGAAEPEECATKQPTEDEETVVSFFLKDSVSRCTSGRKECLVFRKSGEKEYIQKRYLLYTLQEAYQLFKVDHPGVKMGLSKFASLRPEHVLTVSNTPHESCLCKTHENMAFLLRALHDKLGDNFPSNQKELLKATVCNVESVDCMTNKCGNCRDLQRATFLNVQENQRDEPISRFVWQMKEGGIQLTLKTTTVCEAIEEMKIAIPKYTTHAFIKSQQSAFFQDSLKKASRNHIVLQVDFAENYAARYQNAVQSAYFQNTQITIFTAVAWFSPEEKISYALISDDKNHDKFAVHTFLKNIVTDLQVQMPVLGFLQVFSDGAASQFKQKYNFVNLTFFQDMYGLDVSWHFFASGHGKGACDGIGATIKRSVWQRVKSGRFMVSDAASFYACATSWDHATKVFLVTSHEIHKNDEILHARWNTVVSIPGTQTFHSFAPKAPYVIGCKMYSNDSRTENLHSFRAQNLSNGPEMQCPPTVAAVSPPLCFGEIRKVRVSEVTLSKKVKMCDRLVVIKTLRPTHSAEVQYLKNATGTRLSFVVSEEDVDFFALADLLPLGEVPTKTRRGMYTFSTPPL